jgi:hypothetical protein
VKLLKHCFTDLQTLRPSDLTLQAAFGELLAAIFRWSHSGSTGTCKSSKRAQAELLQHLRDASGYRLFALIETEAGEHFEEFDNLNLLLP